jgi:hypothetical protein
MAGVPSSGGGYLTNVVIENVQPNDQLVYTGSSWTNVPIAFTPPGTGVKTIGTGIYQEGSGTNIDPMIFAPNSVTTDKDLNNITLTNESIKGNGATSTSFQFQWPTTTKGDLIVRQDTAMVALNAGNNGQALTPDSTQADGLKWTNPGDGTTITSTFPLSVIAGGGAGVVVTGTGIYESGTGTSGNPMTFAPNSVTTDKDLNNITLTNESIKGNGATSTPFQFQWPSTTKGDIIVRQDTAMVALNAGNNGQALTPDSTQADGLKWINPGDGTTITSTFPLSVIAGGGGGVSTNGTGLFQSGTGTTSNPLTFAAPSVTADEDGNNSTLTNQSIQGNGASATPFRFKWPSTAKGDIIVRQASSIAALAIGTNGQALTPDSTQTDGIKWTNPGDGITISSTFPLSVIGGGGGIYADPPLAGTGTSSDHLQFTWPFNSEGQLLAGTGTNSFALVAGPTGANQVLSYDSTAGTLMSWKPLPIYAGDGITISSASPFALLVPDVSGALLTYDKSLSAIAQLTAGTNGQALTPDSTQNKGLKWTNPGDGVTISSTFPLSVLDTSNYTYVTGQTIGSAPTKSTTCNSGSWTNIQFDPLTSDPRIVQGGYNTSTHMWTCPSNGYWMIGASIYINFGSAISTIVDWGIADITNDRHPDVAYYGYQQIATHSDTIVARTLTGGPVYIPSGTVLCIQAIQITGSPVSVYGLYFSAIKLN